MQINSKSLNIGIVGKGEFSEDTFQPFMDKGMIGLCCGLFSHNYDDIIRLREYSELEDAVEAVMVFDKEYCTYNTISDLLRSCKHVFIGSCVHLSKRELRKLQSLAYEAGVVVQVSMPHRFQKVYHEIQANKLEPMIIECSHYHHFDKNNKNISLIEDLLIPDLDVLVSIANSRVRNVFATGVGVIHEDPDVVNARIEFYNGCVATLSASKISDKKVHKIRFFENNYYHTINFQKQSIRTVKSKNPYEFDEKLKGKEVVEDDTNYHEVVNPAEILEKEIESFYYCITLGTEPVADLEDYIVSRNVADDVLDQLERNFRKK